MEVGFLDLEMDLEKFEMDVSSCVVNTDRWNIDWFTVVQSV